MADPILPGPLWLIGCGNMGGALLEGWLRAGVDPRHVTILRPSAASVGHGIRVLADPPEDEVPALVVLAMKPQQLDAAAAGLAHLLDPRSLLVSVLAGVELASLRARFGTPETIVRAMPNIAVEIGRGVVGLISDSSDLTARANITGLMATLGRAEWFDDEPAFNIVTALAGSGPAFVFRFIEALGKAGAALGLNSDQAMRLALCTVEGSAALAAGSDLSLRELARKVGSPGGTTEAGLAVLDADRALVDLLAQTLIASRTRGLALAAEARASS